MKKLPVLFCGLLLVALPSMLRAQEAQSKIDKITPSLIQTPEYQFNGEKRNIPNQGGMSTKWLEIEVQFEAAPEETDELTVKYFVMIGQTVLSGDVTHVNVPKGRELYSVIYVSPRTLARLLPGKPVTISSVVDVGVQLLVKGQVVYEKSTAAGYAAEWWQQKQQVAGLTLNKNQTPFAPLYWDRYEAIKPSAN